MKKYIYKKLIENYNNNILFRNIYDRLIDESKSKIGGKLKKSINKRIEIAYYYENGKIMRGMAYKGNIEIDVLVRDEKKEFIDLFNHNKRSMLEVIKKFENDIQ